MCKLLEPFWTDCDSARTIWSSWVLIYAINHVLMCMRPEMAMVFGFTVHVNSVHKIFCEKMCLVE